MKYVVALLLFVASLAGCQVRTIVGSTIIVEWDAPDLGAIPPAEITYEVYMEPYPGGAAVLIGTVATLEQPITFTVEGKYKIGVRTRRDVDGETLYSEYAWSDVEGSPVPWYAAYYLMPPKVQRVRIR